MPRTPSTWRMPRRSVQVVVVLASAVLLMAVVQTLATVSDRVPDTGYLLRDTTAIAQLPFWVGAAGRMIMLTWVAAATIDVLAGVVASGPRRRRLWGLALLVGVLALDDTLLLHDALLPALGVLEGVVLVLYAAAGLTLAWFWLPEWRTAVGVAFFAGGALLGLSVVIDALWLYAYLAEELAKLLGVLAWGFCGAWAFSEALAERGQRDLVAFPAEPGVRVVDADERARPRRA